MSNGIPPKGKAVWTLTRLGLCVNLLLNKKKSAREFCRLLRKDLLPHKMERIHFFDPTAPKKDQKEQKDKDWHSICLANDSYQIVVYDKLFQIKTGGLSESGSWSEPPDGVLRLELRCHPPYLKKLFDGKRQHTVSEQIRWLALHSRELILKKAAHAFSSGTHYKPSTAEALIKGLPYHKNTRRQLWWLFKRMRYPFGLEQLPSLPLVLKLLEDDSTTVKLASDGTVEY